ncbi:MAG: DUF4421 domain-containing protein [Alloprevotella sp.]|nr:DUF4421 domain-containing protein [Alloprevotella sp.]
MLPNLPPPHTSRCRRLSVRLLAALLTAFLCVPELAAQEEQIALQEGDSVCIDSTSIRPFRRLMRKTGRQVKAAVQNLDRYDTEYIEPNRYDWTAMVQNTNFFQIVGISARDAGGTRQRIDFAPRPACKIGPYLGWRWIFLGYTIDASRPNRAGKMTEINLSIYSNKVGGDFVFVKNANDFRIRTVAGFEGIQRNDLRGIDFSGLSTYTMSLNAYYVFNNHHFSYPAAYNQSTLQRRSAGSFLLGFRYDQQRINFDYTLLPGWLLEDDALSEEMKFKNLSYRSYCINVGYAYNWVVARNCLVAISLTPALGFKRLSGEKLTGKKVLENMKHINFDFLGRAGFVWNTGKCFAGVSFVSHLYDYRRSHFSVANSVNYLNIYSGFYFGKRRKAEKRTGEKPSSPKPSQP